MTNKSQNYMLQEATLERVPEEGITHTTDPSARLWPVEVHFSTGLRPSRETVRATSADQALEFVAARYRFADMGRTRVLDDAPKVVKAPPAPLDPPDQTMEAPLDPPPAPIDPPAVQVVPGEKDAQGRTLVSDQNARAAAILHVSGQATWEELARTIGCNRDHLRRKASSFKPQLKAADLVPAAAVAPIDGTMIGFMPSIGWAVVISSSVNAMTAAGFTDVSPLQAFSSTR